MLMAWAVLVGVVVGCSPTEPVVESPSPVVSEEPSPTPVPTPTPTGPVKPERPADMDRTDEVGAAAAATYFLELYPYVMATGDLTEWDAMTWAETCDFCSKSRESALAFDSPDFEYVGGAVKAELLKAYALDTLIGGYPLDFRLSQEEAATIGLGGEVLESLPAESDELRVEMMHDGSTWRVIAVAVLKEVQ